MRGLTTLIFDMDGTLIDSKAGLLRCLKETLRQMGGPALSEAAMVRFIGPPFQESLRAYCGYSSEKALRAREIFCALYENGGLVESTAVPGICDAVLALRARGLCTAVASSKPESFCRLQLAHLKMDGLMDAVAGSNVAGDLQEDKAALIAKALQTLGVPQARWRREVCMIGDRKFDAEGAGALGIRCVGFNPCAYTADAELWDAGACAVLHTAKELQEYLLP